MTIGAVMPRFFADSPPSDTGEIVLFGENARHIALSLRMAKGDTVIVNGLSGEEYECVLTEIHPDRVAAEVTSVRTNLSEPPVELRLYVALPKGDKLDLIIQKATELGVSSVIPFVSERCVVRPDPKSEEKKLLRRQRIAEEAAKQCGRGIIPKVYPTKSYGAAIKEAAEADIPLFFYEKEGTEPLYPVLKEKLGRGRSISVVTGSEGGFSPREALAAESDGMIMCGLGRRILRCETAPIYVLSAIAYESELNPNF